MKCPNCGKPLRHEDSDFCSECGFKIKSFTKEDKKNNSVEHDLNDSNMNKVKKITDYKPSISKHNLEFSLALIGVIISLIGFIIASINYPNYFNPYLSHALSSIIVGVIGAFIVRYFPKIGAILLIIAGFIIFLTEIPFSLIALLFYIISVIVCYARN